jgi:hypothetical protein
MTPPPAKVPGAPVRVLVPTFPLTPPQETFIPAK